MGFGTNMLGLSDNCLYKVHRLRTFVFLLVDFGQLEFGEAGQIFVAARNDLVEIFLRVRILLQLDFGESGIVPRHLPGLGAPVLARDGEKFLVGVGELILFVEVGNFNRVGRFAGGANARLENFHGVVQRRRSLRRLPPRVAVPAKHRQRHDQRRRNHEP